MRVSHFFPYWYVLWYITVFANSTLNWIDEPQTIQHYSSLPNLWEDSFQSGWQDTKKIIVEVKCTSQRSSTQLFACPSSYIFSQCFAPPPSLWSLFSFAVLKFRPLATFSWNRICLSFQYSTHKRDKNRRKLQKCFNFLGLRLSSKYRCIRRYWCYEIQMYEIVFWLTQLPGPCFYPRNVFLRLHIFS